jgi:hypothetical protein
MQLVLEVMVAIAVGYVVAWVITSLIRYSIEKQQGIY